MANRTAPSYPLVSEVLGTSVAHGEHFELAVGWHGIAFASPGLALTPVTQEALYRALVPISTSSFGADMTDYWRDRSANGYFERLSEFVVVADELDQIVGWTGYSVLDPGSFVCIYIDSSGVVPTAQSRGVMRDVLQRRLCAGAIDRLHASRRLYVSARSESPIVYKLMCGIVGPSNLFPNPDLRTPPDVLECGKVLAAWLGQAALIEEGSLIVRNAYANLDKLYGNLPVTGDPALDTMFHNSLGPLDAYLLTGRPRRVRPEQPQPAGGCVPVDSRTTKG